MGATAKLAPSQCRVEIRTPSGPKPLPQPAAQQSCTYYWLATEINCKGKTEESRTRRRWRLASIKWHTNQNKENFRRSKQMHKKQPDKQM